LTKIERTMYIYAFRYALNRYNQAMPDCIAAFKPKMSEFESWELDQIINDIKAHWRMVGDMDRDSFNKVLYNIGIKDQQELLDLCVEELKKRAMAKEDKDND